MTTYGYARVSTKDSRNADRRQHPENQVSRLLAAGVPRRSIFVDRYEGKLASRPEWDRLLAKVQPGDVIKFTKLDRIGRSTKNLIDVTTELRERGIDLVSLDQGEIDTTTATGKMFFTIMAAMATFEADMTSERVQEGMDAARERHGGTLPTRGDGRETARRLASAQELIAGGMSRAEAARVTGLARATIYRHLGSALAPRPRTGRVVLHSGE